MRTTALARSAALFTYGAMAKNLSTSGNEPKADPIVEELHSFVASADGWELVRGAVGGLGNAAMPATEPILVRATQYTHHRVHAQTAQALRSYDSAQASTRLIQLSGDSVSAVQQAALRALLKKPLSPEHHEALATIAEAASVQATNLPLLVNIAKSTVQRVQAGAY